MGFLGSSDGRASACNAGDLGWIPELGRSPGEGNGNPIHYSCLENPMDGGAPQAIQSRGSQTAGQDWATSLSFSPFTAFKKEWWGFPGGPVVKNPPGYVGDTSSIPGLGRSHLLWGTATELALWSPWATLLSPRVAATEACVPEAYASQQGRPSQWESLTAPGRWAFPPQLDPHTATKTQHSHA